MSVERRGQAIRVMVNLANWQQEEPTGCGGGRQLSMDGTSRVTGDSHARFCERLGVKFPGPTRRWSAMAVPTATDITGGIGARVPHSRKRIPIWNNIVFITAHVWRLNPGNGVIV
jgi:hypothetical protein